MSLCLSILIHFAVNSPLFFLVCGAELDSYVEKNGSGNFTDFQSETFEVFSGHRRGQIGYDVQAERSTKKRQRAVRIAWRTRFGEAEGREIGAAVLVDAERSSAVIVKAMQTSLSDSTALSRRRQKLKSTLEEEKCVFASVMKAGRQGNDARQAEYVKIISTVCFDLSLD